MAEAKTANPLYEMRQHYIHTLAPLLAQLSLTSDHLSAERMKDIHALYEDRSWNVCIKGYTVLGGSLAGSVSTMAGSFFDEGIKKIFEAVGGVLPNVGKVVDAHLDSKDIMLQADTRVVEHHKESEEKTERKNIDATAQYAQALSKQTDADNAQFHLRG